MEPTQTASAAYTAATTIGQAVAGICPTWLGRAIYTVSGVTRNVPSHYTFYAISSALALGSLAGNAYELWSVSRKVNEARAMLANPVTKNREYVRNLVEELKTDLRKRVCAHDANTTRNFLTLNAIGTTVLPTVVMYLTIPGMGLAPLGTATVSLLCRGVATVTYRLREAGLAGIEQDYIKQLHIEEKHMERKKPSRLSKLCHGFFLKLQYCGLPNIRLRSIRAERLQRH